MKNKLPHILLVVVLDFVGDFDDEDDDEDEEGVISTLPIALAR